jgi:hypothetical protein
VVKGEEENAAPGEDWRVVYIDGMEGAPCYFGKDEDEDDLLLRCSRREVQLQT